MKYLNGLIVLNIILVANEPTNCQSLSYFDARKWAIEAEDLMSTGSRIHLNEKEENVAEIFRSFKHEELVKGEHNHSLNAPEMHFFKAKPIILQSKVFKFLKHMPKGANLHLHNAASVSSEWMVRNFSYTPGLLRCTNSEGVSILSFRRAARDHGCTSRYVFVADERKRSSSVLEYERNFEKLINLRTTFPEYSYPTIDIVWTKFQNMFTTVGDALRYLPVFRAYHFRMLEEMYADKIMSAEVRISLQQLYDLSGRSYSEERTLQELIGIVNDFKKQQTDFLGIKIIYSSFRGSTEHVRKKIEIYNQLYKRYPDFIVGFDLVGQEDKGKSLFSLLNVVNTLPPKTPLFLHAGETNSYGGETDLNLLDAILLNTKRIGHGYALMKHPILYNSVKKRNIAVEVNPISNQVLHLVSDLRNHPASLFIAHNIPFVICNDDPGFWDAEGLSYDFYYAIMSFAPQHAGLKTLKSLVWNSIEYSVLSELERSQAFFKLDQMWNKFITDVLDGNLF